ncbi:hypothetical protein [Dickeya poaceiphila]|uniref:Uncharacterized protein n=1 Tax=Dickeya poaceiphila TaxID=568768 RepID=A0A5B8IA64_9GAMM|nr:hypothetical protein [Dickeya poaceiphila]QDX31043.1 hypothetical protein Dpoa569_0003008 [Dickeya poaceiphila]
MLIPQAVIQQSLPCQHRAVRDSKEDKARLLLLIQQIGRAGNERLSSRDSASQSSPEETKLAGPNSLDATKQASQNEMVGIL